MKIDWKYVATTEGYKSLKAAYVRDVQEAEATLRRGHHPMRKKAEFYKHFTMIINRAIHYAQWEGVTIDVILDRWQKSQGRSWWLNYISINKHTSGVLKRMGKNGYKKEMYSGRWARHNTAQGKKNDVCAFICRMQKQLSTKKPARWNSRRKNRGY